MNLPPELFSGLAVLTAVGCGLIGGLLFAFSNFVMKALAEQPPESGIRTMRAINRRILNPLFLSVFMGTALASAILLAAAFFGNTGMRHPFLICGGLLYLLGGFGVTAVVNVPLNNRLEALDPASPEASRFWPEYVSRWVKWNHFRAAASLAASALIILALRHAPSSLE
ncbi:MAG: anthrone oxygenase family protein [Verrucomicrobiota bacterium]